MFVKRPTLQRSPSLKSFSDSFFQTPKRQFHELAIKQTWAELVGYSLLILTHIKRELKYKTYTHTQSHNLECGPGPDNRQTDTQTAFWLSFLKFLDQGFKRLIFTKKVLYTNCKRLIIDTNRNAESALKFKQTYLPAMILN